MSVDLVWVGRRKDGCSDEVDADGNDDDGEGKPLIVEEVVKNDDHMEEYEGEDME